jgi:hypothetical protein
MREQRTAPSFGADAFNACLDLAERLVSTVEQSLRSR